MASPELPSTAQVDIVDVVENIECELQQALATGFAEHYWLMGWASTITLDLATETDGGGSGEVPVSVPLMPETFAISIAAGASRDADSKGNFSYHAFFVNIAERPCQPSSQKPSNASLTERTGIGDWLRRVADDAADAGVCPSSIGSSLEFKLATTGDGNPTIKGVKIGDSTLEAGVKLGGSKVSNHQLSFAAVPIAEEKSEGRDADKRQVDRIFARAAEAVFATTGFRVDKESIQSCTPLGGTPLAKQRERINPQTKDNLDRAAAGLVLQDISRQR